MEALIPKFNYILYVVLMMTGLWGMIAKENLVKKILGMAIFQTSLILFYISTSVKRGATIPIIEHEPEAAGAGQHVEGASHLADPVDFDVQSAAEVAVDHAVNAADYMNPLPHVLMLTAIVVGVGTLGVALALVQLIYKQYGTLEEEDIIRAIEASPTSEDGE